MYYTFSSGEIFKLTSFKIWKCTNKEFPNVVSEKMTKLSPNREIEFIIDFIPRIELICIPLYQMAYTELNELKVQL